ncbi:MAG TPA: hypothetical protein DDW27_08250 [Bacteroidales bacterium]|nr:hypothetical protein [Bacteroidales bacterium]
MMLGLFDEFEYFQCSNCGCLQISDMVENLSKYYPENYYSFSTKRIKSKIEEKVKNTIKGQIIKYKIGRATLVGYILSRVFNNFYWIFKGLCDYNSKILDIGCGNGNLLLELNAMGFNRLKGLDPFISKDINYLEGVTVEKKEISDIDETFDLIMFHHSFEHIGNPEEVLRKIYDCLNPKSYVLIRIPVSSCYAFRKYGINWVQLDAPRHFFLHTPVSINILAERTHFKVVRTIYDSTSFQFSGSIKYENNYTGYQVYEFSKKQLKYFEKEAKHLNNIHDGDSACFYLQKG